MYILPLEYIPAKENLILQKHESSKWNKFFVYLIYFQYQILTQFPQVSIHLNCSQHAALNWCCKFEYVNLHGNFQTWVSHTTMTQLHGTWVLCFHEAENAIRQLLLLGLCRSSINTVPASLILLLAMLQLTLCSAVSFINLFPYIMPTRQHRNEGQPHLCMAWQQWTVSNSKSTQSKLCSACNTFKLYSWCENLMQTDYVANMQSESPTFAISQVPCWLQTFFCKESNPSFQRLAVGHKRSF